MDPNLTEHPLSDSCGFKPPQMLCKTCEKQWVVSVSANHCLVTENPIPRTDPEIISKDFCVFRGYEIGDFL
jgi:hypothetical protein